MLQDSIFEWFQSFLEKHLWYLPEWDCIYNEWTTPTVGIRPVIKKNHMCGCHMPKQRFIVIMCD